MPLLSEIQIKNSVSNRKFQNPLFASPCYNKILKILKILNKIPK